MIKFPRSLIYFLKIIGVYEILKNIYIKHLKFLGILKNDIETSLFFIFLNIKHFLTIAGLILLVIMKMYIFNQ